MQSMYRIKTPKTLSSDWFLYHDNSPTHMIASDNWYLASQWWVVVHYPQYLRDLAPCDFFRFPKMKIFLNGKPFDQVEAVGDQGDINFGEFHMCFKRWEKKVDKCIASNWEYFERSWNFDENISKVN